MSVVMDLGTKFEMRNIYVRLLGEGVEVYRPVRASMVSTTTYILGGTDVYDPEDEEWEFPPGSLVNVQERTLNGEIVLVAISKT
jgi:hypothetical protein